MLAHLPFWPLRLLAVLILLLAAWSLTGCSGAAVRNQYHREGATHRSHAASPYETEHLTIVIGVGVGDKSPDREVDHAKH